jgi:acyl carrier protein
MLSKEEAKAQLADELGRLMDTRVIDFNASLTELGWDSMMLMELVVAADVVYERRINLQELDVNIDMPLSEIFDQIDAQMREQETQDTPA